MEVVIIGEGAWGGAVASLLVQNKVNYRFWKPDMKISPNSIVILAIPTQALRSVLSTIGNPDGLVIVNGTKGIERGTRLLPYQIVNEVIPNVNYLTLIGPSFAEEVVRKMPTLVNLGYRDLETAKKVKSILQTDYFRIKLTKSVRALELSAAFKNIYAIACGVADGLGYGVNTRVKLMLLAIEELKSLRKNLGFKIDEKALPATIGDLILTCSSSESRNFSFGKLVATHTPKESLEKVGATVEGYATAESVPYFEDLVKNEFPLAHFVYDIAQGNGEKNIKKQFVSFVKNI